MKHHRLGPWGSSQLISIFLFSAVAVLPVVTSAQPAFSQNRKVKVPPTVPAASLYYYNGDMRVEVALALDELFLEENGGRAQADASLVFGSQAAAVPAEQGAYLLFPPRANAAALAQAASELKALGTADQRVRAVLYASDRSPRTTENKKTLTNRFSVKLRAGGNIDALARKYRASIEEKVEYSAETYILSVNSTDPLESLNVANRIYETESVEFASPLIERHRFKRELPNDPLREEQWHLDNFATLPNSIRNIDINIEPAWEIATGAGINIAIVDDGLQVNHADLAANARNDIDIDINGNDLDPSPGSGDNHGTSCAGLAGAVGNNSVGVTGVAYQAGLVGVRLIAGSIGDSQEAQGLAHRTTDADPNNRVSVSSNSWGPSDNGSTLETWGPLTRASVENSIANGRGGLGTIITWAAGNGRCNMDNVNLDGYASSRYTIAVGASGGDGLYSHYSEQGASMLVNAPSSYGTCASGSVGGITTTDLTGAAGYGGGDYTASFGGTSAATPIASGVVALMLQANPNLTWRDVQHILVDSSRRNNPLGSGWFQNASGRWFNHAYGFGRLNAGKAVQMAQNWTSKPAALSFASDILSGTFAIPDSSEAGTGGAPLVQNRALTTPADFFIEHVEVLTTIDHTYRGDLVIELISPDGTTSVLMTDRLDSNDNYPNWTFTSVAHWGERGNGTWQFRLIDFYPEDTGALKSLKITLWGHQTGGVAPPPVQEPVPPVPPTETRPVLHVQVTGPALDPEGGPVLYKYVWESQNGKGMVVRPPSYSLEDNLNEAKDGLAFAAGDVWTVSIIPVSEELLEGPAFQKGEFRIESDGSVRYEGWIIN